ncbi:hypothetical protein [Citrobacter portucalensis]|nr:hypothetical protein [Citrobacter portucalensis]WOU50940.1 hypothetical protein R4T22_06795 [Citrobacter portucalensis]
MTKSTNHPAQGPVSLDRLHQIREILSKAVAQSDGGNLGYAMADAVKVIYGSIAAFGAEPVADVVAWNREGEERTCDIRLRRFDLAPGPLFAVAQPAPVVPDEREAFNVWNNDTDCPLAGLTVKQAAWLAWLKRSGTIKSFEPATDEFEVWARSEGLIHDSYGLRTVNTSADVARKAWNACRAAILQGSQPVSNRDELPLDYLQGHKDGLEWAAQLAEANHPQTGDWLYDDPIELAKAIRNGPDMPEGDSNSPVTPDGYVLVPKKLTAENGAKSVLSGEFSETKFINCPECFGDDDCETCDGSGRIEITVPVTWATIKAIWAKGVEHFAAAPQQENV